MSRGSGFAHWASRSGLQTAPCVLLAGWDPAQSLDNAVRPAVDGGSVQVWARPPQRRGHTCHSVGMPTGGAAPRSH
eukprot:6470154-Amphidinium_carterae.1